MSAIYEAKHILGSEKANAKGAEECVLDDDI
jgi:hypothetical protein